MKAVITIGYRNYIVPAEVIPFVAVFKEVRRDYERETGYTYRPVPKQDLGEIEVRFIDDASFGEEPSTRVEPAPAETITENREDPL